MIKLFFILILITFTYKPLDAQLNLRFEHFDLTHGLSQGTINCIFQDSRGFLWFGTQDGLNRYDGNSFVIYQHNPLDSFSLSSKWVYSITEDHEGNLWVGTQNGLNKLDIKTEKFTHYHFTKEDVFAVLCGKNGEIWFKTVNALHKYDPKTNKHKYFEHPIDYFTSNKSDYGFPILEDENCIWIGSANGLLCFIKKYEVFKTFVNIPDNPNSISNNFVTSLAFDNKNNLWIGTKNGLNKFNKKKEIFTRYFEDTLTQKGLNVNVISSLYWSRKNILWIGTFGGGLNYYDPQANTFYYYTHKENDDYSLFYDYVLSVYEDNSLNLWIGFDANGINKANLKPLKFDLIRKSNANINLPITQEVIGSIFQENDSILWIGTWEKGLNIANLNTKKVTVLTKKTNPSIAGNNVHVIYPDKKGFLIIGTRNGITLFNRKTREFVSIDKYFNFDLNTKIDGIRIYEIKEDYKGNVWVATSNGLYRINWDLKTYNSFFSDPLSENSISDNTILCILCDIENENLIWIGTKNGLNLYDYTTGSFKRIGAHKIKDNKLKQFYSPSNEYIYHLAQDRFTNNILWIGTASGLNKYNKKTGVFEYITTADGLPNGTIYEVIQDTKGYIWMSTNRGLARYDPLSKKISSYDIFDGLQGLEFNNGASFYYNNKIMYFGGVNGINYFNPEELPSNPFPPNVLITKYEKIDAQGKFHQNSLIGIDTLVINHNDNTIVFYFSALEFTTPHKNRFMYFVEGLNENWINIGNRNFISFSNIPPGEYTLKVKASNNDLLWSEQFASLKIIVYPPFYKTTWAILLYILFAFIIMYLYIRSRIHKLEVANQLLQEKQLASLEIAKQKEELAIKNKNITDSLNYAKRIQQSLLPSSFLLKKLLSDSFIFYYPKEIVSGDFYYITEKEDKIILSVSDCTGHGVPGALMSIIGLDLLKNIIHIQKIENPEEILYYLNLNLLNTFSKQIDETDIKDGMDIAILVIDKTAKLLHFAGALSDMYLIRDKKLLEINGNRYSIGTRSEAHLTFDRHTIEFFQNDMIYLFTDGFIDQFGGPFNKKFKYHRFRHLLLSIHALSVDKQLEIVEETFENWKGNQEQVDDVLIIGIRL
ncbi:MAG: SpoIIE family protein phosphatase [Bacteroidales bacterium]|nr:SpoIIE family protein phosphatase [Bacteroidales bacterium]